MKDVKNILDQIEKEYKSIAVSGSETEALQVWTDGVGMSFVEEDRVVILLTDQPHYGDAEQVVSWVFRRMHDEGLGLNVETIVTDIQIGNNYEGLPLEDEVIVKLALRMGTDPKFHCLDHGDRIFWVSVRCTGPQHLVTLNLSEL